MHRIYLRLGRILGDLNIMKQDLADLTGINPNKIGYLANGLAERVSITDLARICEVLEVEVGDILELVKEDPTPSPEGRKDRILAKVREVRKSRSNLYNEKRRIEEEEARNRKAWQASVRKAKSKK